MTEMNTVKSHKEADTCPWKDYPTEGKTMRNIARYERGNASASFSGYRLAMAAYGYTFLRYFSDTAFGGQKKALQVTMWMRDILRQRLNEIKLLYIDKPTDTRKRIASSFLEEVSEFPTELFYLASTLDIETYAKED